MSARATTDARTQLPEARRERAPAGGLAGATVIFDLDGTLVDTAPDLLRALNAVMQEEGFPATGLDDVRAMVGRGARALLRRAYARSGTALPEPALDARVARFLAVYEQGIALASRPFPGALETVDALTERGAVCVVATNKPQRLTDLLFEALGWRGKFVRALGADAVSRKKPDAAHLVEAAGGPGALARAIMVGDSAVDVAAARAARIPVVVLRHGYTETPAERLGADRVLDHLAETIPAASELVARRF